MPLRCMLLSCLDQPLEDVRILHQSLGMKDTAGKNGNGRFGSAVSCAECSEYYCECNSHRGEEGLRTVSCCNFGRSEILTEYMGLYSLAIGKIYHGQGVAYHRSIEAKTSWSYIL